MKPYSLGGRANPEPATEKEDTIAKTDSKTVDEYIATYPEDVQAILKRVRSTIRKALPGAVEVISYQMPAYKLHDGNGIVFAGWMQHFSLYGATDEVVAAFSDDLASYEIDKGTIRFPYSKAVPLKLIERITKFRAKERGKRAMDKRTRSKESLLVMRRPTRAAADRGKRGG
jgi:uncharacterized protein YdhG (YjbR/CyaY superfamily)